jgi:hypothetical protein
MVGTEFAHLHGPSEGSLNAMLPLDLAAKAIKNGWAELQSVDFNGLPWTGKHDLNHRAKARG